MGLVKINDDTFYIVNIQQTYSISGLQDEKDELVLAISGLEANPPTSLELRDFAMTQHPHYQLIEEKNIRLERVNYLISRLQNIINTWNE
ncbi:MAG: hypothetical protein ACW98F_00025 [Candidatus Hodarchaeales archaeon]|jgi:hypothetical protein